MDSRVARAPTSDMGPWLGKTSGQQMVTWQVHPSGRRADEVWAPRTLEDLLERGPARASRCGLSTFCCRRRKRFKAAFQASAGILRGPESLGDYDR